MTNLPVKRYTPQVAVFVIVRNERDEILLHQRAHTGFLDGHYDFPSGHVEPGEDIRRAAVRELMEEAGLTVTAEDLTLVHINQNFLDRPYMSFTFIAEKWQGSPSIMEPEKCSDMAFFATDELPLRTTLNVRTTEIDGFSRDLTYSQVTLENYEMYMHEPFQTPTN